MHFEVLKITERAQPFLISSLGPFYPIVRASYRCSALDNGGKWMVGGTISEMWLGGL